MTSPFKELTMQFNSQDDNIFVLPKYQHTSSRNSCTFVGGGGVVLFCFLCFFVHYSYYRTPNGSYIENSAKVN